MCSSDLRTCTGGGRGPARDICLHPATGMLVLRIRHSVVGVTVCAPSITANLAGNNYSYAWTAQYTFGSQKTRTQTSSSNTFTVTEGCGGSGSSADGPGTDLTVSVTITDDRGNSIAISRTYTMRL